MKAAQSTLPATPQERDERLRRARTAAPALRSKVPLLHQLRFDLRFEGASANTPVPQAHVLHPPARAFFTFPCPYFSCHGQFDLGSAVDAALADPSHQTEGTLECSAAHADHFQKKLCQLRLVYRIVATFKPSI
jgi:hypothetical protein